MSTRKIGLLLFVILVIVAALSGGTLAQDTPACEGEYLESVRELGTIYVRALNDLNLDLWYDALADNYEAYQSRSEFVPLDKDAVRAGAEGLLTVFPGFKTEIHFSTVSADCRFVTFRWTSTGTFSGPLGPLEPTGATGSVTGTTIVEIEDGKILHEWITYDLATLMRNVGVTVEMSTPASTGGLTDEVAADFVTRFDAVFNESIDVADELFAEDFVGHLPLAPELTRDGWKEYVESFRASFPDMRQTTHVSFHSGDLLVVRVTYNGTHQADYFGAEPTGNPIAMEGLGIFRFEDGKPVENWAVVDIASVLVQTGVWVPTMPE